MGKFCGSCGAQMNPGASFCSSCGAKVEIEAQPDTEIHARGSEQNAADGDRPGPPDPVKIQIRAGLDSLRQFLRNPKQLIPMLALGVVWLILSLLSALGINPWPVRALSFLTFAQGGMYGGAWGAMGGIIGKAVFAYFVSVLILPLFSGKNPFKGMGIGFKGFLSGLALQSVNAAAQLMLGIGLALVLFNFFTGNASPVNSMAGVVGFMLALKVLWSRGSFFRGLLISVVNKLTRGRTPSEVTVNRVIAGYAAGSAFGIVLTAMPLPYLPYTVGALLFGVGLIIGIVIKPQKEAPAV